MLNRALIISRKCVSSFRSYGSCAASVNNPHKDGLCIIGRSPNVSVAQLTQKKQTAVNKLIPFVKYTNDIEFSQTPTICNTIIISDVVNTVKSDIYFPTCFNVVEKVDYISPDIYVEIPRRETVSEKRAARLIVIRRRKMKKHKLRKLRKRMKFEWAKVRQRREFKKEKAFQAELIARIKEAEKFDAASYVAESLEKATSVPVKQNKWMDSH